MIGKTLAHYTIIAKLGEGGMGEVYRAHDAKLDRDVALKILPVQLATDRERAARFEREARTLASLQHPNIASIYGFEEADGIRFLAMELVEGEDLAARLARGKLPLDEAMRIAQQITLGMEAAHEKGIVHRDLKPANVKVDPAGAVKILDFGLARAYADSDDEQQDLASSPTITAAMTQAGVILGTAAYMSPEQARGKSIDKRSDIWSFGVMFYEMLVGEQLFQGETVTDILGAIVHGTPDLDALPAKTPPAIRHLLKRCLTPDLRDRLRDIGEARYALLNLEGGAAPVASAPTTTSRRWKVAALLLLVLAAGLLGREMTRSAPETLVVQAALEVGEGENVVTIGSSGGTMKISPDGRSVAYVGQSDGRHQIWVRALGDREGRPVQGTDGGHRPFWSPDGNSLGFFVPGAMMRVAVTGGAPLKIANATDGRGATWFPSGTIVYAPTPNSQLHAVSAAGGQPRALYESQAEQREPRRLPDGRHFLFLDDQRGGRWEMQVGSLDDTTRTVLGLSGGGVEYAAGHVFFLSGQTLIAQPLDFDSFQLKGEPRPLAEEVVRDTNYGIGAFAVSEHGPLIYQTDEGRSKSLQWLEADGTRTRLPGDFGNFRQLSLSNDGKTFAATIDEMDGRSDLWLVDVERMTRQRFTFTPEEVSMRHSEMLFTPDDQTLVYTKETPEATAIYKQRIDQRGEEELVLAIEDARLWGYDISPDGQLVLFGHSKSGSSAEDLWITPLSGEGETRPLFTTPFDEWPGCFSPDGRWVAFDSNEAGRREIYLIPFGDERSGKWQVSRGGGRFPTWSGDGSTIYFISSGSALQAVDVSFDGNNVSFGEAREVMQFLAWGTTWGSYQVDTANDRLLVSAADGRSAPLQLFLNWEEALRVR